MNMDVDDKLVGTVMEAIELVLEENGEAFLLTRIQNELEHAKKNIRRMLITLFTTPGVLEIDLSGRDLEQLAEVITQKLMARLKERIAMLNN